MDVLWDQKVRTARVREALVKCIDETGERDISIVIAALVEMLSRVSDWNLEAERKSFAEMKSDS